MQELWEQQQGLPQRNKRTVVLLENSLRKVNPINDGNKKLELGLTGVTQSKEISKATNKWNQQQVSSNFEEQPCIFT